MKHVKAIYMKDSAAYFCDLGVAIWDVGTDLAVFRIHAPPETPDLFDTFFWLSDDIPAVGDPIVFIGFGEMQVTSDQETLHSGQIARRLVMRVGLVEAVFPDGYYMLKGPCIETSVSIYSGMSGGAVARWRRDGNIEPFAFISHAPEPQPLLERDKSGHAMGSIINAILKMVGEKKQAVGLRINHAGVGRNSQFAADFPFFPDN
ncbi:hypothetical protein UP06_03940 [Bradyrhizobium sp. LTSP857]|nr:hypothetical protein UP06_03940 [Bradyrhizobium sp. LTSP857]